MIARNMGIKLSLQELRGLNQGIGGNYWGSRIMVQLAKENGINTSEFEEFNDLSTVMQSIKNARISSDNFIRWYVGNDLSCFDLLNDSDRNNSLATALCSGAADSAIFKENSSILQAALIFDQDDLPVTTYHRTLSDSDKEIIKFMIPDDLSRDDKQTRVNDLISQNADLKEIFSLDSGLKEFLPEK